MKVLILGASGHIGGRLANMLVGRGEASPYGASRKQGKSGSGGWPFVRVDTLDAAGLTTALKGFDAVVNCVAGDASSISQGAGVLVRAALGAGCPRIVHLSSMSVYGRVEGRITENSSLDCDMGWYARAKCEAESHMAEFVLQGGKAVILRPGCVFGPGSQLWVGRIGRWLHSGRLGDVGERGDGWSNLVHVDDVCDALIASLRLPLNAGELPAFNLAAPDSPRWNDYFVDLALALGATPVRRLRPLQLRLDALLAGPPLRIAELALAATGGRFTVPDAMPPGLVRLWAQHIQLDAGLATRQLGLKWTPYASGLKASADWFVGKSEHGGAAVANTTLCSP